jgi:hypothetical protein
MKSKHPVNNRYNGAPVHSRHAPKECITMPILHSCFPRFTREDSEDWLSIAEKVIKSFNPINQSQHLLECAKKAVEMAIEKEEETAMQWLESYINSIERGN